MRGLIVAAALLVGGWALGGVTPVARAGGAGGGVDARVARRVHARAARGVDARAARGVDARAARGVDARVVGSFAMLARVTVATNVRGERVGQQLRRTWRIIPSGCNRSVCQVLNLDRERSAGIHDRVSLHRLKPGYYSGTGMFYAALRCRRRVYPHGSQVPYKLTLTVTRAAVVEGIAFAQRIAATYDNPGRLDSTPCRLGLIRDAARYAGSTQVASPPMASFTETIGPASGSASFSDQSITGSGGAALVSEAWQFGDPSSGPANSATGPSPAHTFSGPGTYAVSLTVTDANGLSATAAQQVTIPAAPGSTAGQP